MRKVKFLGCSAPVAVAAVCRRVVLLLLTAFSIAQPPAHAASPVQFNSIESYMADGQEVQVHQNAAEISIRFETSSDPIESTTQWGQEHGSALSPSPKKVDTDSLV